MNDELRQAVERYQADAYGSSMKEEWVENYEPARKWDDRNKLADAYLAEHPADDMVLVDEEWLLANGRSLWQGVEPMSESQVAEITLALREYYAAQNSVRRAHKELSEAIPPGMLLLHRKPGDADGPRTLYWSWEVGRIYGEEKLSLLNGVERWSDLEGRNVIIIEVPPPREEFLPRLEQEKAGV